MMGLSDGRKSFQIGLAVLIQYRSVTASHPASHVAVAITLNSKASSLKTIRRPGIRPGARCMGSLQRSRKPPGGEGLAVPSPRTPSPALGPSGVASPTPTPKLVPTPWAAEAASHGRTSAWSRPADQFSLLEDQRVWRCRSQVGTGPATRQVIAPLTVECSCGSAEVQQNNTTLSLKRGSSRWRPHRDRYPGPVRRWQDNEFLGYLVLSPTC